MASNPLKTFIENVGASVEIVPYMGLVYARDIESGRQFLVPEKVADLIPPALQPVSSIRLAASDCGSPSTQRDAELSDYDTPTTARTPVKKIK